MGAMMRFLFQIFWGGLHKWGRKGIEPNQKGGKMYSSDIGEGIPKF